MGDEPTVQRWSWSLKDLIRQRARTFRSVERQLGWSNGYLSQALREGPPALKVEQVLAVLGALGVPGRDYFADLYGLQPPPEPDEPPKIGRDEVEALMDEKLAEEKERRRQEMGRLEARVERALEHVESASPIDRDYLASLVSQALRTSLMRLGASVDEDATATLTGEPAAEPESEPEPEVGDR
jgi:hypothetical protein